MRAFCTDFFINDKPLLVPDAGVQQSYSDLDDAASGRDESGVMHRLVVRYKVGSWEFRYDHLTEAEKQYLEGLFPDAPTFVFTHPSRLDAAVLTKTVCYRSKYSLSWHDARKGIWHGYGFSIIAC